VSSEHRPIDTAVFPVQGITFQLFLLEAGNGERRKHVISNGFFFGKFLKKKTHNLDSTGQSDQRCHEMDVIQDVESASTEANDSGDRGENKNLFQMRHA